MKNEHLVLREYLFLLDEAKSRFSRHGGKTVYRDSSGAQTIVHSRGGHPVEITDPAADRRITVGSRDVIYETGPDGEITERYKGHNPPPRYNIGWLNSKR